MRKEILWAIIAGIIFGLVVAYGAYRINTKIKDQKIISSPTPKSQISNEFKITLNQPENEDVVTESKITIEGITKPQSFIIVSGENEDYITQTGNNGVFQKEINLVAGVNTIRITAYDTSGGQSVEKVLVVYSSSFEKRGDLTGNKETTESASTIREKVQAKVDELLYRPKAYLGIVTDIAETNIQIKTKNGEIRQVSAQDEKISIIKDDGKTSKIVNLTDIAIGDFIVAMGYINGNKVLSAQRILITPNIVEPQIEVVSTTFGELPEELVPTSKTLIYSYKDNASTKIRLTDLEDQSNVIYISLEINSKPTLRTIFTTPQN